MVERIHRLILALDVSAQADLFALDGVLEWPFAPPGVPRRVEGREAVRRLLAPLEERVRRTGLRPTAIDSVVFHETADPEVVVVELELRVQAGPTGDAYRLPYIQVFRVRDGEIVSFRDYFGPQTGEDLEAPR